MRTRDQFDSLSPLDYRYWDPDVATYLSENGFTRYKLEVELALVTILCRRGICSEEILSEVRVACHQVTTEQVYDEEDRIHHDIRALVNCICSKVSGQAKPFVHMTATSYDIIDTANALRYKDVVLQAFIPAMEQLRTALVAIAIREAETVQVGRTHGQHAVPITFGFALAGYVVRLGGCIENLKILANKLPGKFSGAVGAYNASSLFFSDPQEFEKEILAELGLEPAQHSTQIVPPEPLMRLLCEVAFAAGVMGNLARDMRHLQRTEIAEVGEKFDAKQVGSSTMPQKRNPINFENVESLWKIVVSRMNMVFMDQISEHQRDLTNSASARTYGEIIAYAISMAKRLTRTMQKLSVDHANLERNLAIQMGLVVAEPLYIVLASLGHPDAHEKVRQLTLKAQKDRVSLQETIVADEQVQQYLKNATVRQLKILNDPLLYTGQAVQKANSITRVWMEKRALE